MPMARLPIWASILERLTNFLAPFLRKNGVETSVSYDFS